MSDPLREIRRLAPIVVGVPLAMPFLWALSSTPDAVFYPQALSIATWGIWLVLAPGGTFRSDRAYPWRVTAPALTAFGLCALACAVGLALQGGALLVILAAMAVLAAAARPAAGTCVAVLPVAGAFWLAGMGSAGVALVQYAAPDLADGAWIAASTVPGRAVGNLRQPNHLATALLCAMVMTAWLWQALDAAGKARGWAVAGVISIATMVLALAMSASRTGALSLGVLLLWAALDQRLPRAARWTLALSPLLYALCWGGLAVHASLDHGAFYGTERLQSGGDISSSRFAIWKNALALLAAHPWTGVGWGHFNEAWTLTPLADRPVAFFDHAHNLPLQLAVEMGIPAALAVLGLLGWALWRARGAWQAGAASATRAAAAMLAVLALHSLLEYPLWYAYFLLPAAWALGLFIGGAPRAASQAVPASPATLAGRDGAESSSGLGVRPGLAWADAVVSGAWLARLAPVAGVLPGLVGALMLAGSFWAVGEHRQVERIFEVAEGAPPLAERIARGRASRLFGHHADYAAVTTPPRDTAPESFHRPLRQLIDTRLLIAWAESLQAAGRHEEALYAAQRLREFRRPDAQDYFKDCGAAASARPWQCETRRVVRPWRDAAP
jgi:O-antigen ligase